MKYAFRMVNRFTGESLLTSKISDLMVRVYGDTAAVTARAIQKATENTKDYSGRTASPEYTSSKGANGFRSHCR